MRNYSSTYLPSRVSQAYLTANAEMARREFAKRKKKDITSDDPFYDFLRDVSPKMQWDAPHHRYIRSYLDKVTNGEIRKLLVEMPPRHGKTEKITVRYPLFRISQNPEFKVIIGAYNLSLATLFTRKSKNIARNIFSLSRDRNASSEWETVQGGGILAAGVSSGVTGRGADLIVIDDPIKSRAEAESFRYRENVWQWFQDDISTRLEPGGAIIVVMTPWHTDDLAGRIMASDDAPNWTVIKLPAIALENDPLGRAEGEALWPARMPIHELHDRKRVLSSYSFSALYQQNPVPREGQVFKSASYYTELPPKLRIVGGIDTAYTESTRANRSAIVVAGVTPEGKIYILFAEAWQKEYGETIENVKKRQEEFKCRFAVEANGPQKMMHDALVKARVLVDKAKRQFEKYAESQEFADEWNKGNVLLPVNAPWLKEYLGEMQAFTGISDLSDDLVDASVNLFNTYLKIKPTIRI